MSKAARIFGCLCFLVIGVPFFGYTAYLTAVQDRDFICGFKMFFGVGNGCNKNWHKPI